MLRPTTGGELVNMFIHRVLITDYSKTFDTVTKLCHLNLPDFDQFVLKWITCFWQAEHNVGY